MSVEALDNGQYQAEFNYSIYYTRRDSNQTQILCVGRYMDVIEIAENAVNFIKRKAVTDTNVLPRYIAYPV
jgi:anthranilate 1,2-dioxygenase small subunit